MKFCDERIQKHLLSGGKIKRRIENREIIIHLTTTDSFFNDKGDVFYLNKNDLTADDWEIVEPEYNWDKIIKDKILCVFSLQKNFEFKTISILSKKDEDNDGYFTSQGMWYRYCKLFNPADFNIAKDLKEYEK